MNDIITKITEWCIKHNIDCAIKTTTIDQDRFIHIKFTNGDYQINRYYTFATWNELSPSYQISLINDMIFDLYSLKGVTYEY